MKKTLGLGLLLGALMGCGPAVEEDSQVSSSPTTGETSQQLRPPVEQCGPTNLTCDEGQCCWDAWNGYYCCYHPPASNP